MIEEYITCRNCPLWETSKGKVQDMPIEIHRTCLQGSGNPEASIMFIGEAPGQEEVIKGRPFIGHAGQLLRSVMGEVGYKPGQVFVDNIVKCRPPFNRTPTKQEIASCIGYVKDKIKEIKPKVIGLLGSVAVKGIINVKEGITKCNSKRYWSSDYNCWCIPIVHPSYVLRQSNSRATKMLKNGLEEVLRASEGEEVISIKGNYKIIKKEEEITPFFEELSKYSTAQYDTETTGLDHTKDFPVCYSFSWEEGQGVTLPLYHTRPYGMSLEEQLNLLDIKPEEVKEYRIRSYYDLKEEKEVELISYWKEEVLVKIEGLLKNWLTSDVVKILANAKFDCKMSRKDLGIVVTNIGFDVILAQGLIDENGEKDLKTLAYQYTPMGGYERKLEEITEGSKKFSYARVPEDILFLYAAIDPDATGQVFKKQVEILKKENLEELFYKIVLPYSRVLEDMEFIGLKVDKERLAELEVKYGNMLEEMEQEFKKLPEISRFNEISYQRDREKIGKKWDGLKIRRLEKADYIKKYAKQKEFNPNSPQQVNELLFSICRLPKIKGESTDKEVLEALQDKHPVPKLMSKTRKLAKFFGTYIKNIPELIREEDRIHSTFNQNGTPTGRLSSVKPNLQNQPKRGEEAKDIRSYFIAPKGKYLIEADFGQAEFRIFGELARDQKLIQDIKNGIDIHTLTASENFHKPPEEITKIERHIAKFTVFGIMYGRGPESLAEEYGITITEASSIIRNFLGKYPEARQWIEDTKEFIINNGYVINYFGRRRRFPDTFNKSCLNYRRNKDTGQRVYSVDNYQSECLRQGINAPIQGTAHDCLAVAAIRTSNEIRRRNIQDTHLLIDVHDALLLETPKQLLGEVAIMLKEAFEKPIAGITVPMAVEIEYGERWSEMVEYKFK